MIKKIILIVVAFALSFNVKAQIRQVKPLVTTPVKLAMASDSLQYTLGAFLGQWIINNGFTITNPELFRKGMDDVLLNKDLLVDASSVSARLDAYQKRLISERSTQQEKLLFENVRGKTGVGMLPSGVAYVILKAGNGIKPRATDSVFLNVKGYLPDGKLFEDTYAKKKVLTGKPLTFIPGMNEILQIMPAGSTWRVFIPSALGYAERGVPGLVPAYSALIFDVELLDSPGMLKN
ncbi:FKBP-type peptidyl-prolyl cis-trans isomerase [Pedobacter nyackensis]|uniref:Peptidyl-prolyl cis-trans isomerase n=1 Tax=Pedobacter nyackensis TaxID=475255 RepID=A0A1W2F7Q2_9SPHI|nr:FKBP-type peptidyl-prolyl cis-trans isomerase [Pedobacter nyackensis]SMD17842.1 FKBP-type peptidyl-prolyl cis-trans isomerase FklB [Pedobacter nyackensis]